METEEVTRSLKRSHDEMFDELADLEEPCSVPADFIASIESDTENLEKESIEDKQETSEDNMVGTKQEQGGEGMVKRENAEDSLPTPPAFAADSLKRERSRSTSGELTDAGSRTPSLRGDSPAMGNCTGMSHTSAPSAFAALNGSAPPPKKVKLTFQEKEMRRINKEIKDQERAAEKARKEAEKQAHAAEKARKDAEREVERKKKEAEREDKRKAVEVEKAAKEEKRRLKEEEKAAKEEKKKGIDKGQLSLGNFFAIPNVKVRGRASSVGSKERSSMSPAPSNPTAFASPAASTPSKPEITHYEKMFPAFFAFADVTVAPITRFERDEDAFETIQNTIDSYILRNRSPGRQREYDAQNLFHLSNPAVRGKKFAPVKEIMEEMSGNSSRPIDLTTDSQNSQIKKTTDLLRRVPFKILCFQEDVRPPFRGTYTSRPVHGMAKLARNPLRKDLPDTNYDYDSEAEWVEDEDAEDLKSEADDEEEVDEDEDMEEFLDDENDETAHSRRLLLQGDLQPVSTGLCWEDRKRRNVNVKMMPYRMEIILADRTIKSIDPFSTAYWDPPKQTKSMDPPRLPLNTMKLPNTSTNPLPSNGNKSVKPFFISTSSDLPPTSQQPTLFPPPASTSTPLPSSSSSSTQADKKPTTIPDQDMPAFKAAIEGSDLSKVGLIEVLKKKFPGRSGKAIKATLEGVARRVGGKEVDKRWVIL